MKNPQAGALADRSKIANLDSAIERTRNNDDIDMSAIEEVIVAAMAACNVEIDQDDPLAAAFTSHIQGDARRLLATSLLRVVGYAPNAVYDDTSLRVRTYALFDQTLSHDLYPAAGVSKADNTYEKHRGLSGITVSFEANLHETVESFTGLAALVTYREELMKLVRSKIGKALLQPYCGRPLLYNMLDDVFQACSAFAQASEPAAFLESYKRCTDALNSYRDEALTRRTRYCADYIARLADLVQDAVASTYQRSQFARPTALTIVPADKTYPFRTAEELALYVVVENQGPGYAFDTELTVGDASGVTIDEQRLSLGTVKPGLFRCRLTGRHAGPSIDFESAEALIELSWRHADGALGPGAVEVVEFCAQSPDIPWERLRNPYELEPVSEPSALVGRAEIVKRILTRVGSSAIASTFISGQKRVGKTSIARAAASLAKQQGLVDLVVFIEAGDVNGPGAETIIQRLVRRIGRPVERYVNAIQVSATPAADKLDTLSDLIEYLDEVWLHVPNLRILVVIDEFDEFADIGIYKRGPIADSFFQGLRSLSGREAFGFILVGAQRMDVILSIQGYALNKFEKLRVDSFDRHRSWSDYSQLVEAPVAPHITYSDEAVESLYELSGGNPFFTKLVAQKLFDIALDRRDAHITASEVVEATDYALSDAGGHYFQHFWEDGILDTPGRREDVSVRRRKVLLSIASDTRARSVARLTSTIIRADEYGLSAAVTEEDLRDFQRRSVVYVNVDGEIRFTVPLFGQWLDRFGTSEIVTSMSDLEAFRHEEEELRALRIAPEEARDTARRWRTYRGNDVTGEDIQAWLHQFRDAKEQRAMFHLLTKLRYFSQQEVRQLLSDVRSIVLSGTSYEVPRKGGKFGHVVVSYLDGAGKSGSHMARLFADEHRIYARNVIERSEIGQRVANDEQLQRLVLLDDFVGTGGNAKRLLKELGEEIGDLLLARAVSVRFVAVTGLASTMEEVELSTADSPLQVTCHLLEPLGPEVLAFEPSGGAFANRAEAAYARSVAEAYGRELVPDSPLGFGGQGALVAFYSTIPNNALPILWSHGRNWTPLFPRY